MVKDSAWTWAYFFAAPDKASVKKLFGARKQSVTLYRIDKVVAIRGDAPASIKPDSRLVRVEVAARLTATTDAKAPTLLLQGVPQHLEYMSRAQRDKLSSRPEFAASKDTIAVVIPIRKSAAWWALAHDERSGHFQQTEGKKGHTAIGAAYVDRIHRKLYHTRYAVESSDHDFITYFEFDRAHTDDFQRLLTALRDPELNPEWKYVDREYEIWMTKSDKD
jgi:chlorite dismutase